MELEEGEVPKVDNTLSQVSKETRLSDSPFSDPSRSLSRSSLKANGAVAKSQFVRNLPDGISRLTNSGINFAVFNGRRPVERKTVVPKMESRKNQVVQETVIPLLSSYKSELSELETERERRRKQWQSILEKRKSCDEGDVESTGLPSIQCVNKSRKTSDHSGQVDNTVVEEESEGESNESKVLGDTRDYESFKEDKEIRERLLRIREDSAKESVEEGHKVLHSSLKKEEGATKFSVDIFSDSPVEDSSKEFLEPRRVVTERVADDAADLEGYCKLLPGDRLDNDRYTVLNIAGKGVFSSVVRALEQTNDTTREVAIKIIRNNDVMLKAAQKEISILRKLEENDRQGKRHCIQFLRHFNFGSHICLVFESMQMNLREVLKKYGGDRGISIKAVQLYTRQLLNALYVLYKSKMIHADLKPDNILVNEEKNMVKICDFGSACFTDECDITPYLVSRFYRAPEIILGLLYGPPVDMWSLGCCLFELYTGKVAFPGRNNNEMLRLFQELKGSFSMKMIRKSPFRHKYFDSAGNFLQGEWDPVSRSEVFKATNIRPKVDLKSRLLRVAETEERKLVPLLADFLDKIFTLDPFKRLSVIEASKHPFVAT
ncbi:serine/threonine-protein kinase PRP4 [Galdieria sulphuraria]|uniref:non-specific serine/threonine protein kinase n=1 Tax=Galdieria sulphuraria TaxID=130081 RepID=M2XZ25_GALSU|nr:serine/threonine-protein kinase PRP4 [Galdieria sulphuraria]EME28829.1 serine/threonine-protein kinase PRP4 [Galdieria sulphuraria]|eukprot:XP_005705349.1 serine/threonine-protein kinase PRP4 [Galdieria sulphuraria]